MTKYTCVLGGTAGLSGHIKLRHGHITLDTCGVQHRTLAAADACSERHTRSLKQHEWARGILPYSPVADDSDYGEYGPVKRT